MLYWKDNCYTGWIPGIFGPSGTPKEDPSPSATWEDNAWYKRWFSWKGWFVLDNYPIEERYEMWDWASRQFGHKNAKMVVGRSLKYAKIYFKRRKDAAFFRLTWL